MACTRSGRAAIKHGNGGATCRQPPGYTQTDDAGADDGDPRLVEACRMMLHPAAPYAGMTQTGSMGLISAATSRHPRPFTSIIASFGVRGNPRDFKADRTHARDSTARLSTPDR